RPGNQCILDGIGSVCDDGTIYAGERDGFYYFTSASDELNLTGTGYGVIYGGAGCLFDAINTDYGMPNQEAILAKMNTSCDLYDDYDAIKACGEWLNANTDRNLGYTDWYLPAENELHLLWEKRGEGSLAETFPTDTYYWTSTEISGSYSTVIDFNTGNIMRNTLYELAYNYIRKQLLRYVRCIRSDSELNTNCPNSGDLCPDETIYVGMHGGKHIFTMPQNEPVKYIWGAFTYDVPGANNVNDGYQNFIDVVNGKTRIINDIGAARVCQRKNENMDNTHSDWYLPAYAELHFLCGKKSKLGDYFTDSAYFSSTESNKGYAYEYRWSDCRAYTTTKGNTNRRAHCVRREPKASY
ncbi:MAG: DUF1566 domain-containing protein, partial [Candidatus Gastranaerophilales bacterium]|nr:DUF1566 domain-containing protein [Candidatus Gastranaerophilales bacterium]